MIYKKIKLSLSSIFESESKNIRREIDKKALESTANYVVKNINNVASFDTKYKVHDFAIKNIALKNGIILEFGVYKGETINYLAKQLQGYDFFGFDSFNGLPEFWRDGFDKGTFAVSTIPTVENNVKLIKGWFNETLPEFVKNEKRKIAYLHIDCDLYSSTKTIFHELSQLISSGTIIVFDEYFNYPGWENGEYKAFQEFISEMNMNYKYLTYNHMHEQVAVIIGD